MTSTPRLLFLDRGIESRSDLPVLVERENESFLADSVATISEAMGKLVQRGYEAVLCRVDAPEELSYLIRIRHAAPSVSIVAFTPGEYSTLADLARESGADDVRSRGIPAPEQGKMVLRDIGIHELIARAQAALARNRELHVEHRQLRALSRRNIAKAHALSGITAESLSLVLDKFAPLLVEDDPAQGLLLKNAFQKTAIPFPLPVVAAGLEAIKYLAGDGDFGDRRRFPFPTLVLLDLHLPDISGFEVLKWIRSRPAMERLSVFILSSSTEELDRAMAEGANYFYSKPGGIEEFTALARAITVRWWMLEKTHQGFRSRNPDPSGVKLEHPPCPKCGSQRINKIGHEPTDTARWVRIGQNSRSSPTHRLDYIYLCEQCGNFWRVPKG